MRTEYQCTITALCPDLTFSRRVFKHPWRSLSVIRIVCLWDECRSARWQSVYCNIAVVEAKIAIRKRRDKKSWHLIHILFCSKTVSLKNLKKLSYPAHCQTYRTIFVLCKRRLKMKLVIEWTRVYVLRFREHNLPLPFLPRANHVMRCYDGCEACLINNHIFVLYHSALLSMHEEEIFLPMGLETFESRQVHRTNHCFV